MTPSEVLTSYENQVLDAVKQGQNAIVDAVKTWAEAAKGFVPELPSVPGLDKLPEAEKVVDSAFEFVDKLLVAQREFIVAVLDAAKPVLNK